MHAQINIQKNLSYTWWNISSLTCLSRFWGLCIFSKTLSYKCSNILFITWANILFHTWANVLSPTCLSRLWGSYFSSEILSYPCANILSSICLSRFWGFYMFFIIFILYLRKDYPPLVFLILGSLFFQNFYPIHAHFFCKIFYPLLAFLDFGVFIFKSFFLFMRKNCIPNLPF